LSVIPLRSVSCVFTIKIGLEIGLEMSDKDSMKKFSF